MNSSPESAIDKNDSVQPSDRDVIAYTLHGNCYLNITSRCTLRCAFCPKFNKSWEVQGYLLKLHQEPGVEQILDAVGDPGEFREIVFCGLGEPTLRLPVLLEVAEKLKKQGARIRLNTDGLVNMREGRDVIPALGKVIDAISISVNGQNEAVYNRHCRPPEEGAFLELLEFIPRVRDQIDDVSITAIDGLEGLDIEACEALANRFNVGFRRRVLDQVG